MQISIDLSNNELPAGMTLLHENVVDKLKEHEQIEWKDTLKELNPKSPASVGVSSAIVLNGFVKSIDVRNWVVKKFEKKTDDFVEWVDNTLIKDNLENFANVWWDKGIDYYNKKIEEKTGIKNAFSSFKLNLGYSNKEWAIIGDLKALAAEDEMKYNAAHPSKSTWNRRVFPLKKVVPPDKKFTNKAVQALIDAGPDSMSHMFDVFFYVDQASIGRAGYDASKETDKEITNQIILSSRILSIEIPNYLIDEYDEILPVGAIKKGASTVSFENKSSFSFRVDNDFIIKDMFDAYSLTSWKIDSNGTLNSSEPVPYSFARKCGRSSKGKLTIIVKRATPTPATGNTFVSDNIKKAMGPFFNFDNSTDVSPSEEATMSQYLNDWFVFEDVKILGSDGPISFTRDDANTSSLTEEFIFKRFYRFTSRG